MNRRVATASTKLFGATMLALVLASLALVSIVVLPQSLIYDEAYNLQVAESLRSGAGYSTFGSVAAGDPWPFDPHITTGPVVLLPVALAWALSDGSVMTIRALMLAVLFIFAAGWWQLMREAGAGWGVRALVLVPALAAVGPTTGRVLGELPGAALLVWAGAALVRRRPMLAALAIGLAVQAKVVYGLAGVLVLAVWLLGIAASTHKPRVWVLCAMAGLVAAPSLLFELFRYASLGSADRYLESIAEFQQFLVAQNVNTLTSSWLDEATLGAKMSGLFGTYPTHAWIALAVGAGALICVSALPAGVPDPAPKTEAREHMTLSLVLAGLLLAGGALALGWLIQSSQTASRQVLPFFLLSVPALVGLCLLVAVRFLDRTSIDPWRLLLPRVAVASGAVALSLSMLGALAHSLQDLPRDEAERATEQRHVSSLIRSLAPASIYADGWWQNPEYQLLSGVAAVPWKTGERQLLVVQDYQVSLTHSTWTGYLRQCAEVVYRSRFTLLCWLPEHRPTDVPLQVLDWGPRSSKKGEVPDEELGGAAMWFRIARVPVEEIGRMKVHVGDYARLATLDSNGTTLTVTVPPALFSRTGEHEVILEQLSTRRKTRVGILRID